MQRLVSRLRLGRILTPLVALASIPGGAIHAQLGFRDLDPLHPVPVEDAAPVARYAFEFLTPWDYVQPASGAGRNQLDLDLAYGVALNWHTGVRLPLAFGPGGETGVAGIGAFALFNPVREGAAVPALSLRGDVFAPTGTAARGGLTAIATRSLGAARVHLNLGGAVGGGAGDELPWWRGGVAVDYTFFRPSLLVVGALAASQADEENPTATEVSAGVRWQ